MFILGPKHAKLMAGLFCLARESWNRGDTAAYHLSAKIFGHISFFKGLQSVEADSLPEKEGFGGGYGK